MDRELQIGEQPKEQPRRRAIAPDGAVLIDGKTFGDAVSEWDQLGLDAAEFPDARLWGPDAETGTSSSS